MIHVTEVGATPRITRQVVNWRGLAAICFGPGDYEPLRGAEGPLLRFEDLAHGRRILMELDKGTIADGSSDGFFVHFGGAASTW